MINDYRSMQTIDQMLRESPDAVVLFRREAGTVCEMFTGDLRKGMTFVGTGESAFQAYTDALAQYREAMGA